MLFFSSFDEIIICALFFIFDYFSTRFQMKSFLIVIVIFNLFVYVESVNVSVLYKLKEKIIGNGSIAPYNTIIGYASTNVASYSNGDDHHTPIESDYLYKVYIGMKWQCVEFARRWLFLRKGCVFHEIVGAADIWTQVYNVQRVVDKKCFNFTKYPNGNRSPPLNETLLIYDRSSKSSSYGHVAVIVDVLPNSIRIAEQNYNDYYWTGNYSRELRYVLKDGLFYIEDEMPVLGWMQINDHNQTKPLDQQTIYQIIKLNGTSPDFICHNNNI